MPRRGLEPLILAEPDPKSGASTNFATSACFFLRKLRTPNALKFDFVLPFVLL